MIKTLGVVLAFIVLGCSKKMDSKKVEDQLVFDEIFPELLDEVIFDFRKLPPPPPPPSAESKNIGKLKTDFENYLKSTKFEPLFVVVKDTISAYSKTNLKYFYEKYDELRFIDTTEQKSPVKFDFIDITLDEGYKLKYKSSLRKPIDKLMREDLGKERHERNYVGVLNLTRIYFDKKKEIGFFSAGTDCGKLCGSFYYVIIKKVNRKWKIYKKISAGIV